MTGIHDFVMKILVDHSTAPPKHPRNRVPLKYIEYGICGELVVVQVNSIFYLLKGTITHEATAQTFHSPK